MEWKRPNVSELAEGITQGQRRALAKAITLVESSADEDFELRKQLLMLLQGSHGRAFRIGISGVPGVGKSTFIEAFGLHGLANGYVKKLGVLAVDPSSPLTGGSLLGDKTRMHELGSHPQCFIRPSPSKRARGGVALHTRNAMRLFDAFGMDVVIIETVGVGQGEYSVAGMVDCFILLQLPHAGDELQGMKRGILELADIIVINKADGDFKEAALLSRSEHERALMLLRGSDYPSVLTCSARDGSGIEDVWQTLLAFKQKQEESSRLWERRAKQALDYFDQEWLFQLEWQLGHDIAAELSVIRKDIARGVLPVDDAVAKALCLVKAHFKTAIKSHG